MKSPFRLSRFSLPLLLLIILTGFSVANAQDDYPALKNWEAFDFAGRSIKTADISTLSIEDLKLVRGIVFGKHGRLFKEQ